MLSPVNRHRLRLPLRAGLAAACGGVVLYGALAANADPLPPLPGPNNAPATTTAPNGGTNVLLERARRGIVTVERDGHAVGVGTVLSGDGRIVTAASALGDSDHASVRYADGRVVDVRVGHREKAWDLALLIPQSGRWTDGLMASSMDPSLGGELDAFVIASRGGTTPALVPASFKAKLEARGKDGEVLSDALDFDLKGAGSPSSFGAPILDMSGGVAAIIVHACKAPPAPVQTPTFLVDDPNAVADGGAPHAAPLGPCTPIAVGAPVRALRHFLITTPPTAIVPQPWLGIRGEPDSAGNMRGVRIIAVATGSPADKAGLKANLDHSLGDLIVAVDEQPVETPEKLSDIISRHGVGDKVKLLVFSVDRFHEATVELRANQP